MYIDNISKLYILIHDHSSFYLSGAIPWFIVAEVFSQTAISAAISIVGPTNWLCNFAVGLIFPFIDVSDVSTTKFEIVIRLSTSKYYQNFYTTEVKDSK